MRDVVYSMAAAKPLLWRGWGGLHLGSTGAVTDINANVSQTVQYAPFGEVVSEYIRGNWNDYTTDYLFNAKELDEESGMYYYSARYYSPPIFTARDLLEDKYPGISPYAYCLNNPLRFIDPDGRTVVITGDDGNSTTYTQGMEYKGNDEFTKKSISYLNILNDNGGSEMLGELINSPNNFNMKNQIPVDRKGNPMDAMQFSEFASGGGDILAGIIMNPMYSEYSNVESFGHELFHGLQHENKQGGASVFNEVEANVFSKIIADNWLFKSDYYGAMSSNGLGNGSIAGNAYQNAFSNLLGGYSDAAFNTAVQNFKIGSNSNASGGYNNYPIRNSNQTQSLLMKYYPK